MAQLKVARCGDTQTHTAVCGKHLWIYAASVNSDNPSDPMRLKRGCKAVTPEAFDMHAKVAMLDAVLK